VRDAELPSDASARRARGAAPVLTVTVTCCRDLRAHEGSDVELAAAAERRDGRVRAVCGHVLSAAPMVAPDGPPCPLCEAIRTNQHHEG
jgi:hypothetical protein